MRQASAVLTLWITRSASIGEGNPLSADVLFNTASQHPGSFFMFAYALDDEINGAGEFIVLFFEHFMQRMEIRAGDVPVKILGFQIQGIRICQKVHEFIGYFLSMAVLVLGQGDDWHGEFLRIEMI